MKVAVIGGGIAGLTCAWELHKAGMDVELFERKGNMGGRMSTRTKDGLDFDLGANFLIRAYKGGVVIVSHDRHLIASCADRILVVAGGVVTTFDGDLEDYRKLRMKEDRATRPAPDRASRKDERRAVAEARGEARTRLRPLEKAVEKVEARLAALSKSVESARAALADPALYEGEPDVARLRGLQVEESRLAAEVAAAEEDWLHASARLETARQEAAGSGGEP